MFCENSIWSFVVLGGEQHVYLIYRNILKKRRNDDNDKMTNDNTTSDNQVFLGHIDWNGGGVCILCISVVFIILVSKFSKETNCAQLG